jgi:hypothetical protein
MQTVEPDDAVRYTHNVTLQKKKNKKIIGFFLYSNDFNRLKGGGSSLRVNMEVVDELA